jgi:hypothetical protein
MKKIDKKKRIDKNVFLIGIVIFQIILLMGMTLAQSYFIDQTNSLIKKSEKLKIQEKKSKNLIDSGINLLKLFFSIKQIGFASAIDLNSVNWNCCPKMKDGSICQDIASITPELCTTNPIPTKCDFVAECERGCCIDSVEGLCTTKSTKQKCTEDGGVWEKNENCLIGECQKNCCVLGNSVQFVTEKRCELLSLSKGFEKDFRNLQTEPECLALFAGQIEGACILNGVCSRRTEQKCFSNNGNFYPKKLCSNPELKTSYIKQHHIGCVEGKNEIYWFDDHNNLENIYSSNNNSWNNGNFLTKQQSCNPNSNNIDSENCGNCGLDSKCVETTDKEIHVKDGNYVCKDLKCYYKDEFGNNVVRKNGESWCVYDSFIGDGKDTAGSRHWQRYCIDGEIKIKQCADYRGEVCAQTEMKENDETFSIANCVLNEAQLCIDYNSEKSSMASKCNENQHCMIKNINVDKFFRFDMCVPKYPRGFDFSKPSVSCSLANQKCTVFYEKNWKGKWKCKENCDCEKKIFAEQMNDLCISLGDCGSYINFLGKGTNNIKVTKSPTISWTKYKKYSKPVQGQSVNPQNIDNFLSSIFGSKGYTQEGSKRWLTSIGKVSGGLGTLTTISVGTMSIYSTFVGYNSAIALNSMAAYIQAFGKVLTGLAIGLAAGSFLAKTFDRTGTAAMVLTFAGGIIGGVVGLMWSSVMNIWNPYGWAAMIVAVIIIAWTLISGWGKTKEVIVEFRCNPWQAPNGGSDCERCNKNNLKPCTKYRCESLGQMCKLINQDTENPECVSLPYETKPPVIIPQEILTKGYKFTNEKSKKVNIRTENDKCITAWEPILFSLKTNEYSQCKFSFQKTLPDYENMEKTYPLEKTRFTLNHTFGFNMPSLDSLGAYNISGDLKEKFGNINMYIRCKDGQDPPNFNIEEYIINFCVNSEPDLTPALIKEYSPKENSFLSYGINKTSFTFYLNKPAECKYDIIEDRSYEKMKYAMDCATELEDAELYGWPCNSTLNNLAKEENKIYIKCKNKPWVKTQEDIDKYGERNINSEDFIYTLYSTKNRLKIDSISPIGNIERGFEPISINLNVKTSGGIENGKSICYYEWAGNWVQFLDTSSNSHEQKSLTLMGGNFNIPIKCKDNAGNFIEGNTSFSLNIDNFPPKIVRAYNLNDELIITTDEQAECYYDLNRCNFDIKDSNSMTTAFSTKHIAKKISGKTYYIKCIDIWGNKENGCSIKIKFDY